MKSKTIFIIKFILRVLFTVLTPYKKLAYFSNYIQTVQNVQNLDCVIMYSFFVVFLYSIPFASQCLPVLSV